MKNELSKGYTSIVSSKPLLGEECKVVRASSNFGKGQKVVVEGFYEGDQNKVIVKGVAPGGWINSTNLVVAKKSYFHIMTVEKLKTLYSPPLLANMFLFMSNCRTYLDNWVETGKRFEISMGNFMGSTDVQDPIGYINIFDADGAKIPDLVLEEGPGGAYKTPDPIVDSSDVDKRVYAAVGQVSDPPSKTGVCYMPTDSLSRGQMLAKEAAAKGYSHVYSLYHPNYNMHVRGYFHEITKVRRESYGLRIYEVGKQLIYRDDVSVLAAFF